MKFLGVVACFFLQFTSKHKFSHPFLPLWLTGPNKLTRKKHFVAKKDKGERGWGAGRGPQQPLHQPDSKDQGLHWSVEAGPGPAAAATATGAAPPSLVGPGQWAVPETADGGGGTQRNLKTALPHAPGTRLGTRLGTHFARQCRANS